MFKEKLSWNVAKSRCKAASGSLMSLNSWEELNLARALVPPSPQSGTVVVHVGVVDNTGEGGFINTDESETPFNVDFWGEGHPVIAIDSSNDLNKLLCGALVKSGGVSQIENIDCNERIADAFICQFWLQLFHSFPHKL